MPLVPLLGSVRILLVGQYTCGTVYNYTTQYADFSVYICFPFHNVHIFPQLLYNCLFHYVYSEASLGTYSTVYNYSPQYTVCAVYICCPFHNVIFFHNYCTIHSTTMFTAYPQHIHTILFTITLPSILTVLFTFTFPFTMWYFSTITAQLTLQQCLQHILNIYIRYCLQLHYPVYWLCCLYMLSFSQCDIFPQWLHNSLYNNVYSISSTYTLPTKSIRTPPNIHVVNRLNIQLGAKMGIANIQVSKGVVLVLTLVEIFIILGFHEVLIY